MLMKLFPNLSSNYLKVFLSVVQSSSDLKIVILKEKLSMREAKEKDFSPFVSKGKHLT